MQEVTLLPANPSGVAAVALIAAPGEGNSPTPVEEPAGEDNQAKANQAGEEVCLDILFTRKLR